MIDHSLPFLFLPARRSPWWPLAQFGVVFAGTNVTDSVAAKRPFFRNLKPGTAASPQPAQATEDWFHLARGLPARISA